MEAGASNDNFPVALYSDALTGIGSRSNRSDDLATRTKTGIEATVAVVPDQRKVAAAAHSGGSRHKNLAVRLHGDALPGI